MKKILIFLLIHCFFLAKCQTRYQSTWESLSQYSSPQWLDDAKFGIFIHWGVYSVPAYGSEWYPREMYLADKKDNKIFKHHVEKYGTQDKFGYKDFIPMFKAEKFNADHWVDVFKRAGAKYVVPVAEHHDGFPMYDCSLTRWNAKKMGPKRDIVGEIAAATRKQGLVFGLSSHRIEHWWFFNGGMKFNSDVKDPQYADLYGPAHEEKDIPTPEFMNDWLLRCTELVDKYHPQLFWFDWWIEQPVMQPYMKTFASYYYNRGLDWKQGVAINYKNKTFPDGTAILDIERGELKDTRKYPWQTDTSVGDKSWGYIEGEKNKSPNTLIDLLIDIVSKNGNLLLNIGPKPDGTITPEQEKTLLDMGKWLKVNGEGIYGSRPWTKAGEGPTENAEGSFGESKLKDYTEKDFRFTTKGKILYAYCMDIPTEKMQIKSLGNSAGKIAKIELLGSLDKVNWSQEDGGLTINIPKKSPCQYAMGYRVTFVQ